MKKVVLFFTFCFFLGLSAINANDKSEEADFQVYQDDCGNVYTTSADTSIDDILIHIWVSSQILC